MHGVNDCGRDLNLLFGVIAVQLKKVSAAKLLEAAAAWATDPAKSLAERLLDSGALSAEDRSLITRLVDDAVGTHGGDTRATLIACETHDDAARTLKTHSPVSSTGVAETVLAPSADQAAGVTVERTSGPVIDESPGRYTNERWHASGGMGDVLIAYDMSVRREVAMKVLSPELERQSRTHNGHHGGTPLTAPIARRFLQEARITGQLEHPAILPVHEIGRRLDGSLYYTMKFIRGKTLDARIWETSSLAGRLLLLPHFVQICQAVAYAHSRGVVHRDLKPANVMVGEFGETVVIDWGLSKARHVDDVHAAGLAETFRHVSLGERDEAVKTVYGHVLGTPAYMPPEQANGQLEHVDDRSDVYALGAILYEILAGKPPFSGENPWEVLNKVKTETPSRLKRIDRRIPAELVRICDCAMAAEPKRRFDNATQLAERVAHYEQVSLSLNPFRPSRKDLVPELATLPRRAVRQVCQRAEQKLKESNRRLYYYRSIRNLIGVLVLTFLSYLCIPVMYEMFQVIKEAESLAAQLHHANTAFDTIAGIRETRITQGALPASTYGAAAYRATWELTNRMRVLLIAVPITYYVLCLYVGSRLQVGLDAMDAPWIREAVAEWKA